MGESEAAWRERLDAVDRELGSSAACLFDASTGMLLASSGELGADPNLVATGCTDVIRSEEMLTSVLGRSGRIGSILVDRGEVYDLYHPMSDDVVLWVMVERALLQPAMALLRLEKLCATTAE